MKTHPPLDPKSRTDLGVASSKNSLLGDRLVNLVYKTARLVIETSSKVQEPKTYDKIINDPFNGGR